MEKEVQKKHRFHMPSAFTILFLLIALIAVLTWIIPAGEYKVNSAGNMISGPITRLLVTRKEFGTSLWHQLLE